MKYLDGEIVHFELVVSEAPVEDHFEVVGVEAETLGVQLDGQGEVLFFARLVTLLVVPSE